MDTEEDKIQKILIKEIELTSSFQKPLQVPGIGKKLAITIQLETGDIKRFNSAGNYASYCRCVSSCRFSNGNKYLAWAFVEAANFAIRNHPEVQKFHQRKLAKRGKTVAIKAVAHKVARACYHIGSVL